MQHFFKPLPFFSEQNSLINENPNFEEKIKLNFIKNNFTNNLFSEDFPLFQSDENSNYYLFESGTLAQNENFSIFNQKKNEELTIEDNNSCQNNDIFLNNFIREAIKEDFESNGRSRFFEDESKPLLFGFDFLQKDNFFNNSTPESILSTSDKNNQKNTITNFNVKKNDEIQNNENLFFNYISFDKNNLGKKRKNSEPILKLNNSEKNKLQKNKEKLQKANSFLCKCGKVFSTEENKRFHYLNVHLHIKPFHCDYCNEEFSHRNGKIYHERVHHTFILPYNCTVCDCSFASKSALSYHIKSKHKK